MGEAVRGLEVGSRAWAPSLGGHGVFWPRLFEVVIIVFLVSNFLRALFESKWTFFLGKKEYIPSA